MNPIRTLGATLLLALLPASLHAQFDPIGTITAVVDGEPRTWHIPGATIEDGGSGAMWMMLDDKSGTAVLGGFDSRDIRFGRDPDTGYPSVSGSGSQISISFGFTPGTSSNRYTLPAQGSEEASILLLPQAGVYNVMYDMDEGTLDASRIDASRSGPSAFAGSFSGTLVDKDGAVVHRITDGRFSVDNAMFFELESATD
ncbi:hypothetical protein Q6D67_05035 [Haliea sp. E1-2-M8]|uniref:hypothetical protein n=1 Tax=Haliea sp. E1-2-M8 TaxID=3064706 RepID=UPI0027261CA9|nr:hypothetical protein [Haliea sp. E1-2-M8]MDO8861061.1 hypothetical protein [Haliea sp. E1-2-M8]